MLEEFLSTTLLLFFVMDPIGNIPIFIVVLEKIPPQKRRWIVIREVVFSMLILIGFLFLGNTILKYLNISQSSLKISGSILLFIISLRMIFPPYMDSTSKHYIFGELPEGDPFLFPLAIPSLAGPSAITTVIVISNQNPIMMHIWLFSILVSCALALVILLSSNWIFKFAGKKGVFALEKLMGMALIAISVEMFLKGIKEYLF
ncbi:MAG: MarC family protein [Leptonema sp. (in: bacteria)]